MYPYMGPPASPIPMQPSFSRSSRLLGAQTPIIQEAMTLPSMSAARTSGGLLSTFLGNGTASNALARSSFASTGLSLSTILQHTQRIMGITQQVAPMVQQYGPFLKNIPTFWRMLRSFQSNQKEKAQVQETNMQPASTAMAHTSHSNSNRVELDTVANEELNELSVIESNRVKRTGESVPKLYI